jgi:signal transduction histidine kinase
VATSRYRPGVALAALWIALAFHVTTFVPVFELDVVVAIWVAFAAARWGSTATVVLSAVSIPAVAGAIFAADLALQSSVTSMLELRAMSSRFGLTGVLMWGVAGVAVLAVPWLIGLALRSRQASHAAQLVATQAAELAAAAEERATHEREVAELRSAQTQLARDVHDVVGHSLAVILAQAESAQYLTSPDEVRQVLANIATSARTSLRDVRHVLASTGRGSSGPAARADPEGLSALVENLRVAGTDVRTSVVGEPRPLPPDLETVAARVTQEMLANALRHGDRTASVDVEQRWEPDRLWIRVRNLVPAVTDVTGAADDDTTTVHLGTGIDGMRRRVEAVGGALSVAREPEAGRERFTATAWLPVRGSRG